MAKVNFHLIKKHIKIFEKAVYPDFLDKYDESQIVFESNNLSYLEEKTKDCFTSIEDFLKESIFKFLEKEIIGKLISFTHLTQSQEVDCLKEYLRVIPVYLVSKNISKERTQEYNEDVSVAEDPICNRTQESYKIPNCKFTSLSIDWTDLGKLIESLSWDETEDSLDNAIERKGFKKIFKDYEVLGLYVREDGINAINDISQKSRIYLWVDNIKEFSENSSCRYDQIFSLVLCHEYMHALMDVFSTNIKITGANNCPKMELLHELKEESLANGLALYMQKLMPGNSCRDIEAICRAVKNQPIQYQLGLYYSSKDILEIAVPKWMKLKSGAISTNTAKVDSWLNAVAGIASNIDNSIDNLKEAEQNL